MPFDYGVTILNHEAGIVKRIKDQPAVSLIKQFIQQQNKGNQLLVFQQIPVHFPVDVQPEYRK